MSVRVVVVAVVAVVAVERCVTVRQIVRDLGVRRLVRVVGGRRAVVGDHRGVVDVVQGLRLQQGDGGLQRGHGLQ